MPSTFQDQAYKMVNLKNFYLEGALKSAYQY